MGQVIKRTEYTPLEPGIYPAMVEEVTLEAGQYGEQVKLKFALDDDKDLGLEDRTLIGWASASFGPKSKLWGWTRVLLFGGRDIPDDFGELDIDTLQGRRAMLSVTLKQGTDGATYNKITDLLPIRPARPSPRCCSTRHTRRRRGLRELAPCCAGRPHPSNWPPPWPRSHKGWSWLIRRSPRR